MKVDINCLIPDRNFIKILNRFKDYNISFIIYTDNMSIRYPDGNEMYISNSFGSYYITFKNGILSPAYVNIVDKAIKTIEEDLSDMLNMQLSGILKDDQKIYNNKNNNYRG